MRSCSSSAEFRLAARSACSRTAFVQRSTPPDASSRETAATRCGHVSQYVVGNGSPCSSNGSCSVTAGRPKGQRTATRRNARGARPSCRSTTSRSSTAPQRNGVLLLPARNALDDEQPLARADEAEPPRLPRKRSVTGRRLDESLQPDVLRAEQAHLGRPSPDGVALLQICPSRAVIEQRDQTERRNAEPAQGEA